MCLLYLLIYYCCRMFFYFKSPFCAADSAYGFNQHMFGKTVRNCATTFAKFFAMFISHPYVLSVLHCHYSNRQMFTTCSFVAGPSCAKAGLPSGHVARTKRGTCNDGRVSRGGSTRWRGRLDRLLLQSGKLVALLLAFRAGIYCVVWQIGMRLVIIMSNMSYHTWCVILLYK